MSRSDVLYENIINIIEEYRKQICRDNCQIFCVGRANHKCPEYEKYKKDKTYKLRQAIEMSKKRMKRVIFYAIMSRRISNLTILPSPRDMVQCHEVSSTN